MRKGSKRGVTKMQILGCVIEYKKKGINDDIGVKSGLCTTLLESKEDPAYYKVFSFWQKMSRQLVLTPLP